MTASVVEALQVLHHHPKDSAAAAENQSPHGEEAPSTDVTNENPSLADPTPGNPISHGQIIATWRQLRAQGHERYTLEGLLRGAIVYVPPPPPKPEPVCSVTPAPGGSLSSRRTQLILRAHIQTDEYKALMARLRREEEERSYERMLNAAPTRESFAQRFPHAPAMGLADSFAEANKPYRQSDMGDDEVSHAEIQKQITLIVNFLVSIAGCAAAIWIAAQWWPTPARLFLTLGGCLVVAVAEVAVYYAYNWRMAEGDKKQEMKQEVRQIVKTWVVGEEPKEGYEPTLIEPKEEDATEKQLRKRTVASA